MPKQHITGLMILSMMIILFASCHKKNTQGKMVPKEAVMVVTMDAKSLSSKLPWDEIKKNPLFAEIKADSGMPAAVKSLLDNPENSGVDINADCVVFMVKDSLGGYFGFEGKVKDENIFKTFNKQVTETGLESEQGGAQFISKFPVCVGWTKEHFVYIVDVPQLAQMTDLSRRMRRDSISISSVSGRDIGATCKAIFALKEDNSLAKDEKFTDLMKETGDLHLWVNYEELAKGSPSANALAMFDLDRLYKGSAMAATLNFDNGKIVANAKTFASGEMLDLFKKYSGGKINEDMIKHMPGKDVVAIMALNYKPEALADLLKLTKMDGLINVGLSKLGFTMNDFIKANKGDFFIGLSDLVMKPDTTAFQFKGQDKNIAVASKPNLNFIFAASIGDKESFNKLVNAGKTIGGGLYNDSSKSPVAYNLNAKWFAMGNDKQVVDQYLGSGTTNFAFIDKIGGQPFGGYLNIQALMKSFGKEASKDSSAKIAYDASLQFWDNVIWKGGNYSGGGITQTVEVNLVDKSTNSLKQLNQYAAKLSELYKEHRQKQKADMLVEESIESGDTTRMTPPAKAK